MHSNWCYWPCACLMLNRFKSPTFKVWSIRMSMILKMSGDPGIPCMKWIWKQDWNSNGLGASNLVLMSSIPLFKFWISPSWGHKATLGWWMDTGTETNMSVNWVNFNSHPLMTVMKLNEENWKLRQAWGYEFLT